MATPTLIYCASGNARFAGIAISAGYKYGSQLPGTVYFPLHFADQNWKRPDKGAYLAALATHWPYMASVLDWERPDQLSEVLAWAEDASQFVEVVMIIPKVQGGVGLLPRVIGGKPVRLGYSVPTRHGGTELPLWEFNGWPVHLLGGSPGQQMKLSQYLNVVSADGNMAHKMATQHCAFWQPGRKPFSNGWSSLKQASGGARWGDGTSSAGAPYEAFRRSCENIMEAWRKI